MTPSPFAIIDWRQPWFAHYRDRGEAAAACCATGLRAADALNRCDASEMRFVEAARLPAGQPYESFIRATRCVPTRNDLHDFFNGLVWLAFPLSKRRLNELQSDAIRAGGSGAARGPLRDAITVFDENGALLQAPAVLLHALAARDWRRVFVELRPLWKHARLVLFGHALLEKLVRPRKAVCAHVLPLAADAWQPMLDVDALDSALAALLNRETLTAKPFLPLPVLGVPGWWAENGDSAFYDDVAVFRPRRRQPPDADAVRLKPRAAPASVAREPAGIPADRLLSYSEFSSI